MEVRPGYKQTEVGVIPEDWNAVRIDSLTPPSRRNAIVDGPFGSNLKTIHYRKSGIPIITSGYVTDGIFRANSYLYVDRAKFLEEKRSAVQPGDIVMAKIGERCGASAILPETHETGILSGNALKITVDESQHCTSYVWHMLWNLHTFGKLDVLRTVGAQPALSMANLKRYKIPVPPTKSEQRAIAAALSDVDALLGGLDRLIAKKCDLKQAAMQQLLTGQTRLPGFSGAWEVASLDMLASRVTGVWGKNEPDERNSHLAEIIRAGDISQDGRLTSTATRYVAPEEFEKAKCALDDLVITTSGNGLGKLWWCDGRINTAASNFVRVLHPKATKVVGRFLYYALRTGEGVRQLQEHTATSAYPNLRPTYFSTSWIPLPVPSEQTSIAAVLSDMDAELAALEARRDKTRYLKHAMMQELLTGKTRLVKPEAAYA